MPELIEDVLRDVPGTAARVGKVSPWTIYKWISVGKLKKTYVGGRVMIAESDVQRFLADCAKNPSARGRKRRNS
jgi:excisionase family DNA binding protein